MSDSDRKVRGERIRSSRAEKQLTDDVAGDSNTEQTATTGSITDRASAFSPETFVETDAVKATRERAERWLAADRPVHFIGPTGCGKTALAMRVAQARGRPTVFINGDADLTTADLVGEYAETERESVRDRYVHNVMKSKDVVRDRWVDNPVTVAVREGGTLVYNEFSRAKPTANNVLLSVFEEGVLELPGKRGDSRYVEVHPEFRAILTSNSAEYAGVHTPQDALLDRLIGIHMDFYDRETELAIVNQRVADLAEPWVGRVVDICRSLRENADVEVTVGTRAMVMAAEGLAATPTNDREAALVDICLDALSSKAAKRSELSRLRSAVEAAAADTQTG